MWRAADVGVNRALLDGVKRSSKRNSADVCLEENPPTETPQRRATTSVDLKQKEVLFHDWANRLTLMFVRNITNRHKILQILIRFTG